VPVPHLDRLFDYLVPQRLAAAAVPGVRVRVRLAGHNVDGFVVERVTASDHAGRLVPLRRVVSPEPVLTPQVLALARAVADHYAGTFSDVLRLAVPPRHAAAEAALTAQGGQRAQGGPPAQAGRAQGGPGPAPGTSAWAPYPAGAAFLARLAAGEARHAVWSARPGPGWTLALAEALAVVAESGRGSVAVVPDHRDLDLLEAAVAARIGGDGYVRLSADLGVRERYTAFLRALRGEVLVVIGTRAAAFAPVPDVGLLALWEDGDPLHAEQRAPYPHAREVLALRAGLAGSALLVGGWARTPETEQWLRRGTAREIGLDRQAARRAWPRVLVAADAAHGDPLAVAARLPRQAFEVLRDGQASGPVLVQVPRTGYLPGLACQDCRRSARCAQCTGPLRLAGARQDPSCGWCGRPSAGWQCPHCHGRRLRARAVGVERTAEELGRAFPGSRVVVSRASRQPPQVDAPRTVVLATPGVEPVPDGGYSAAVLLDGDVLLERPDLRAGEEALRRWLGAAALVRPASAGGRVVVCADPAAFAVEALARTDPAGFARRELDERAELRLPPAVVAATLIGPPSAVAAMAAALHLPAGTEVLGPVPVLGPVGGPEGVEGPDGDVRLLLRAALQQRRPLTKALREAVVARSARREDGVVRVRIDPLDIG